MPMIRTTVSILVAATLALAGCASGARSDFGLGFRETAIPVGFPGVRFSVEDALAAEVMGLQLSEGAPHGADGRFAAGASCWSRPPIWTPNAAWSGTWARSRSVAALKRWRCFATF